MTSSTPLRLAFIGWGAIAQAAARLLAESPVEIVAVAVQDGAVERRGLPATATVITDPAELAAHEPTVVAEAGGRTSVGQWGFAALDAGADFVVSSVSAFADPDLLATMREAAASNGVCLQVQPGALGGVDALASAKLMGIDTVEHRMVKPPQAWKNTPAETLCDLNAITEPTTFFTANAAETANAFPKNANVAMTTALAGIGPEATTITLVADPTATTNRHEIAAAGAFGSLDVVIANNPLPENPKSSAMAALNLVRAIENRANAFVI